MVTSSLEHGLKKGSIPGGMASLYWSEYGPVCRRGAKRSGAEEEGRRRRRRKREEEEPAASCERNCSR